MDLWNEALGALRDKEAIKVIATVDESGTPHVTPKATIEVDEQGKVYFVELIESSRTGRNLVRALWRNQTVSVLVIAPSGAVLQCKGTPVRSLITGEIFRQAYLKAVSEYPGADPAAVWEIELTEITDQSWKKRIEEEGVKHPYFLHLDRIARA